MRTLTQTIGSLVVMLTITGIAFSQPASPTRKPSTGEQYYSTADLTVFGGWQWFQAYASSDSRTHKLQENFIVGARADQDFSNHIGLEEAFTWGPSNHLRLRPYGEPTYSVTAVAHNYQAALTPLIYLTPRESKVRPYATAGFGYTWFSPGTGGGFVANTSTGEYTVSTHGTNGPALVYGGGIKFNASRVVGFRVDVRGMFTKMATFGLPSYPPGVGKVYIGDPGGESAIQVTGGILFRLGLRNIGQPPMMTLSCASNPPATVGRPYSGAGPSVSNGTAPYTYSATGLPAGLSMEPMTGAISGTPTAAGSITYMVRVTDSTKQVAETMCSLTINPAPAQLGLGAITGGRDVCPGENLTLTVTPTGVPAGQTVTYQWTINGQPVAGAGSNTLQVPTAGQQGGNRQIAVRAMLGDSTATSGPVTVRIRTSAPPTVQFNVTQTTLRMGVDRLPLNATATGSECTDPVALRYTASEGAITGNTFDCNTVSMDLTNRVKLQTKPITLTAIATDKNGTQAQQARTVTCTLSAEARRLDDIVFPASSARVNNCAKRLLLEVLTPLVRDDPNGKVIFIGHRDMSDRGTMLDQQRVLNASAVISAGSGICPSLEVSRINGNWVGTDQATPTRPNFCGTSVTERGGQVVRENDARAQYRRVEVWFVPSGADMPAGVTANALVEADVKKLACPR